MSRFKERFGKAREWVTARSWLHFSLIGLVWALVVLSTVGLKNKIARGEWPLPDLLAVPGDVITNFEYQSIDWRFSWRGEEKGRHRARYCCAWPETSRRGPV